MGAQRRLVSYVSYHSQKVMKIQVIIPKFSPNMFGKEQITANQEQQYIIIIIVCYAFDYSVFPISLGYFSLNNSRKISIMRGLGVFCEFEVRSKSYIHVYYVGWYIVL